MEEPEYANRKFQKELSSGVVALVLLAVLDRTREPLYGYQIAKQLESSGESLSMVKQGSLYPVLRSLEKSGFLESEVEPSTSGPPRRYYRITSLGRGALAQWTGIWREGSAFVDEVLKGNIHVSDH